MLAIDTDIKQEINAIMYFFIVFKLSHLQDIKKRISKSYPYLTTKGLISQLINIIPL